MLLFQVANSHPDIMGQCFELFRVSKNVGGVVSRDKRYPLVREQGPPGLADLKILFKESFESSGSEGADYFGANYFNLVDKEQVFTGIAFFLSWPSVVRGAAFDDVGNK